MILQGVIKFLLSGALAFCTLPSGMEALASGSATRIRSCPQVFATQIDPARTLVADTRPRIIDSFGQVQLITEQAKYSFTPAIGLVVGGKKSQDSEMEMDSFLPNDEVRFPMKRVWVQQDMILNLLYRNFSSQGPERASLVSRVMEQDEREQDRIIHFFVYYYSVNSQKDIPYDIDGLELRRAAIYPLLHMQLLLSAHPDDDLHVEHEVSIGRSEREVVAELGRFTIAKSEQKRSRTDTNQMSFIKNQVLLQVFIWLGLHPEVGRVFLQVNEAMKRNLLKQNLVQPSQLFSQFSRSYDTAIGQQEVTEFVFQFDQSEVHQLALYSLRKQILDLLERFFDRPEDRKLLKWTLSLQDLKLWEGLGLVERVDPKSSIQWEFPILPKYSMGNRVGDMRILPVHYRSLSKESKEFLSAQERKSPSWLFFYFENAFYGLSQLRAEDPPTEGPLFKISSDLPTEAKYLSLFITEETARQMAKRLMRPEAP